MYKCTYNTLICDLFGRIHELQFWGWRQGTHFRRVTIKQMQPLHTSCIELVVDVLGEVVTHVDLTHVQSRSPFPSNLVEVSKFQSAIARLLKHSSQIQRGRSF